MGAVRFMRPDEMMTLYGTVSGGAATGYDDDWLVDGKVGRPVKTTTSTPPWVITGPSSKLVDCVVVANHNIDPAKTIAITGGVSVNLVGPALRGNGIPFNAWASVVSPATTNTITVTISSNSVALIVGEVIAGRLREVPRGILMGNSVTFGTGGDQPLGVATSLPGYDDGTARRAMRCECVCTTANKDILEGWWEATRGDTRPSVLIPDESQNDAWVGHLTEFRAVTDQGYWRVAFTFVEYARTRW